MNNRRSIQQAHERAYVRCFLKWFNRIYRCNFEVISEPNPPEAIICSTRTTRWVEVSTAFWNGDYARDLYSYATSGEEHKPVSPGPFKEMDKTFAKSFVKVIKKKLEKESYVQWRDLYGPGYLIVPIKHPWFNEQTIAFMKEAYGKCVIKNLGCFRSISIAFQARGEIKFSRWRV